jgi:XTP/dITP diphosphohydrolase
VRRLKRGGDLVVASHNAGKVREIRDLLAPFALKVAAAATLGLAEPEEIGATFAANAALKARAAAEATGKVALADDSGLCVVALGGQPGVHSARWAGERRDFAVAMERVWREMQAAGGADRRARFVCALALAWPDGAVEIFEGEIAGEIVWPPRGAKGFGYDPFFVPAGGRETFGEMAPAAKHAISHRAMAFRKLIDACLG